jgi:predicted AAA+ superfamily ATPase
LKREAEKQLYAWKERRDSNGGYKNLLISGPKFAGKKTLVEKFARENYELVVVIDCANKEHVDKFDTWEYEYVETMALEPLTQLFRKFSPGFVDSENTAIVITEIQFSSELYSYVSQMTFILSSRIIITGSYLYLLYDDRMVRNLSTEVAEIRLSPLSFFEFAQAFGYSELYESIDIFGDSEPEKYDKLRELFEKYLLCGGYPSVVQEYLVHKDIDCVNKELERIHCLLIEDLSNIFFQRDDLCLLKSTMDSVAGLLMKDKGDYQELTGTPDLFKELASNIEAPREKLEKAVYWLYRTNLIGICGRAVNCKYSSFLYFYKFYFSDVGLARWLIERSSKDCHKMLEALAESYVFNIINNYAYVFKFRPDIPMSATYNGGEIDFLFRNKKYKSEFAIDVKYGELSEEPTAPCEATASYEASTASYEALRDGVVNRLVKFQGEGPFGKAGEIYTVPIYLIDRFDFNIGGLRFPEMYESTLFKP